MEEDKPNSDIEFEDEEVEEEGDVYLLEDNEDEVLKGDKEYFSNSDPAALEIVEPVKKAPEKPIKVKGKDKPNWMHPLWDLHKAHNECQVLTLPLSSQRSGRRASQSCQEKGEQASTTMVTYTTVGMKVKISSNTTTNVRGRTVQ